MQNSPDLIEMTDRLCVQGLSRHSIRSGQAAFYGYPIETDDDDIQDIEMLRRIARRELERMRRGYEFCLTAEERRLLFERVNTLSPVQVSTLSLPLTIDDSNQDAWNEANPYCVQRETWEKIAYQVCGELDIKLQIEQNNCEVDIDLLSVPKACELSFDIRSAKINCDIFVVASVYKQACNLDMKVSYTEKQCDLQLKTLASEHQCDLNVSTYSKLVDAGLTSDMIALLYENHVSASVNSTGDVLVHVDGSTYPLKSIAPDGLPSVEDFQNASVRTKGSQYLKNPNLPNRLKKDYKK